MTISINWATKVITVQQADLTLISAGLYELDVDVFRQTLKNLEDAVDGMAYADTHRHNTEVTLGGVTLARTFEIINGYTITFENGNYAVRLVGANNNIADVMNINSVSLRSNNSAGLISVGGANPSDIADAVIDRAGEIASAVWNYADAVEIGLTPIQTQRLILAMAAGKISGAETATMLIRAARVGSGDGKVRITATTDENGNRTGIILDVSP